MGEGFLQMEEIIYGEKMKLKINEMDFKFRTDIIFRMYVLFTNDKKSWKEFCSLKSNRKVRYSPLFKMRDSIRKKGQRTPIKAVIHKGQWYPGSGATRLSCLWALGKRKVKVKTFSSKCSLKWNDHKGLVSSHLRLKESTIDKFLMFVRDNRQDLPILESEIIDRVGKI
ncbi:hypothetical protein LCGC14_0768980 [marine sediment metagenome]|uniref:Uncharacterized protein n=1 Tax=marine sediment metagenome TaxID=412755 RepID=A0A0F9T5S3_9ZZZZ